MQKYGRTFVIGDVHGAAKALEQCLERSGADLTNDRIIQLGDVADGYADVYACVEILLRAKHLIALKGNHDDWFLDFINTDFHPHYWNHGGPGTLESYLEKADKPGRWRATESGYKTALVSSDIPHAHRQFFMRQRHYYVDERNRCYVHGGFKPGVPLELQRPQDFYWDRTLWENAQPVPEFHEVYLGHTPTINWETDQPMNAYNLWNLDTGAGHSGRLTIMDADTKEYWQSDALPDLYAKGYR
ncbi:metallophosphoesterase [Parapedobacter pyrenivorans]|uniref:metallophosphoesterase n=1 Tax=Parapedobacter pyrenivorans TaxID=1305674 RepID=UPI001E465338|nr:metallophosphoesterase [Parapedobacter pyrenivorans]